MRRDDLVGDEGVGAVGRILSATLRPSIVSPARASFTHVRVCRAHAIDAADPKLDDDHHDGFAPPAANDSSRRLQGDHELGHLRDRAAVRTRARRGRELGAEHLEQAADRVPSSACISFRSL